jgi:hypothetical protein
MIYNFYDKEEIKRQNLEPFIMWAESEIARLLERPYEYSEHIEWLDSICGSADKISDKLLADMKATLESDEYEYNYAKGR